MVSTKAHMHGGIDKQISRVLQRDLTGSMIYGSQPWGVDSGNSMFQVRCHRSSHIFSLHLLVNVCVDYIKLLILFSLDAPFFTIGFHFFPWPFSDLGNESSAPFLTPQQALRPRSDVDIRAVLDEQTHVPRGPWIGAFCKVAFSSEMI